MGRPHKKHSIYTVSQKPNPYDHEYDITQAIHNIYHFWSE